MFRRLLAAAALCLCLALCCSGSHAVPSDTPPAVSTILAMRLP